MTRWLSLLVLALCLGWLAHFAWANWAELAALAHLHWWPALGMVAAAGGYLGSQGILLRASVHPFGAALGRAEGVSVLLVTFMFNYVIPASGVGFRGVYLHRVRGLSYQGYLASQAGIVILELMIYALGGLAALWLLGAAAAHGLGWVWWLFAAAAGGLAALAVLPRLRAPGWLPWAGPVQRQLDAWFEFRAQHQTVLYMAALTLVQFGFFVAMFWLAFAALGLALSGPQAALVTSMSNFAFLLRLSPGSAGTFEAAVIYPATAFALTPAQGLLASLLIRVSMLAWGLALGPLMYMQLNRRLARARAAA